MTGPRPIGIKVFSTISCILLFLRLLSGTAYFPLARLVVFCSAIYIGWYAWNGLHKWWFRLMALVGLLFNPLFPIGGQSFLWTLVDWGCGMLFLPWSFFESSGGKIGRPVEKPTPSKTSSSSYEERSFPEPAEEQLLKFLVGKRSKRRLAGPNSSIITIWVFPKWNAILKQLPESIELADRKFRSRCPWRCRIFSDMVNGLWHARTVQDPALLIEGQTAENEFLNLNEIKISMSRLVANGGRVGVYGAVDGNPGNRFLRLGFNYHKEPKSFLADFNGVLGVLMLDDVLNELLHIESIAIGASLEKPLRSDQIREYDFSSEVDEENSGTAEALRNKCALRYESAFNPVEDYAEETWLWKELPGSHIFENSLVTVAVKYQGNAGAFTRISKYSDLYGLELDEFEIVYRKSTPERISKMSGIRKNLQDVWISESPRVPSLFNFSEDAIEKERREFFAKQKSIQERARSLVHGLSTANIETSEWLSYLEISFYLREAYEEVAQFGRSCQIGKWNIKVVESTQPGELMAYNSCKQKSGVRYLRDTWPGTRVPNTGGLTPWVEYHRVMG
jgi:hypothetical protein